MKKLYEMRFDEEIVLESDIAAILSGESMPETPTQNELADVVKKILKAFGGTITPDT